MTLLTSFPSICTILGMVSDTKSTMTGILIDLAASGKFMIPIMLLMVLFSGFRSATFTMDHLRSGGPPIANTLLIAWICGTVIGPLLLPWLPGRSLPAKGWMMGILGLLIFPAACFALHLEPLDVLMALLVIPSVTLFLMTNHIHPIPLALVALAAGIWTTARFI